MPNESDVPANAVQPGSVMGEVMRQLERSVPGALRAWQPAESRADAPARLAQMSQAELVALCLSTADASHPPVPPCKFFVYDSSRWSFTTADGLLICHLVPRTPEEERDLEANRGHIANLGYAIWRFGHNSPHLANLWPAWGRKKVSRQIFVKVGLEFRRYSLQGDWTVNAYGTNFDGSWATRPNEIDETKRKAGEEQKFAVVSLPVPGAFSDQDITDQMEFSEIKAPLPIPAPR